MKPLGRKNYGSIPHLSNSKLGKGDSFIHIGQEKILTEKLRDKNDVIFVTEKYDGSNVGVAKKDGKIYAITRSGYEAKTSPYKQHHLFNDWVVENESVFQIILNDGDRICGEWLAQSHSLKYKINNTDPIVFFDLIDKNNNRLCMEEFLFRTTHQADLNVARIIFWGGAIGVDEIKERLFNGTKGFEVVNDLPEGMVYRVERNGKVDFLAKWVRGDFKAGKNIINKKEEELIWNYES